MLVIAHRGDRVHKPENTMAAFKLALEEGADGIELDVQLTSDGEIVVCHDETVNRTTNGTGYIKDMTYKEVLNLDAGEGQKIPSLSEVMDLLHNKDILLNIELKNSVIKYQGLENKVINALKEYKMLDKTIISSFNHHSLLNVKELAPTMRVGILFECMPVNLWGFATKIKAYSLHPFYSNVDERMVKRSHEHNIRLFPWTVNNENIIRDFFALGVDAIITDDPLLAVRTLRPLDF